MRLGITNDHRGYKLKVELLEKLKKDYEVIDYGAKGTMVLKEQKMSTILIMLLN